MNNRAVRRLYQHYKVNMNFATKSIRSTENRRDQLSKYRNARNAKKMNRENFGIRIPNNTRQALLFDQANGNHKWAGAISN